jgi:hypothetical protein
MVRSEATALQRTISVVLCLGGVIFAWPLVQACGSENATPPAMGSSGAAASRQAGSGAGALPLAGAQSSAGVAGTTAGSGGLRGADAGAAVGGAGGGSGAGGAGGGAGAASPSDPGAAAGAGGSSSSDAAAGGSGGATVPSSKFSFFLTSVGAIIEMSKNPQGFGGDLRFGKETGLEGADEICRQIAEKALPGAGNKQWRAFLSATRGGPGGGPIHAKDRIGEGPWYDRLERLVAANKDDLLQERPRGADPAIIDDLPNENGIPNHVDGAPGCAGGECPDNHQVLTGTNEEGMLRSMDPGYTCNDWTSSMPEGTPWCGHSWPREQSGVNWMSAAADGGCAPCVSLVEMGGVRAQCVGSAGGYGGFYCFAFDGSAPPP